MTNVIKIEKRGNTITSYSVDEQVMNELRLRMYQHEAKDLAALMRVTPSCIYSIKSGRTKWPRGRTLFALLTALEIEFRLYDIKNQRYL